MAVALILSGGVGKRMGIGKIPKQYLIFEGKQIISYSLKTFDCHPLVQKIVIVADKAWRNDISSMISDQCISKFCEYADPGDSRQLSILNGLKIIHNYIDMTDDAVIIHDAARPMVSADLITRCILSLNNHDGVMPVLPAKDTFYILNEYNRASKVLPRQMLVAGQAPEVFRFQKYLKANLDTDYDEIININGSTELALKYNFDVITVPGDERNIKITTPNDLILLKTYMEESGL